MSLLDELQAWLKAVARGGASPLPPALAERGRDAMIRGLRGLRTETEVANAHARWASPGAVEAFLAAGRDSLLRAVSGAWTEERIVEVLPGQLEDLIVGATNLRASPANGLERFEIGAAVASGLAQVPAVDGFRGGPDVRSWAGGVGALDARGAVTTIGQAIVRFRGRDALWFLLELEVAQSTGRGDGLRLPRAALVALRRGTIEYDDSYPEEMQPPFAWVALQRWAGLGILVHEEGEGPRSWYSVEKDAQELVDTVISAEPNPFRALVEALLADERGGVTSTFTGVAVPGGDPSYGRMVAHEVGNIVLPLRTALDRLWRELERTEGPDPARVQDLRERLDRGVQRLGTFAAQAASIADAVEPEEVDLLALAEEAVEATKLERNGRIKADLAGLGPVRIEGPRQRWVLLFVNLFRNAAQVRDGSGTVWVSSSQAVSGAVDLLVDDDGPGVPEDLRERIFQRGFSARGGDGFGLSDVRLTVQRSSGTVTCLASPRGGTRFHIRLPAGGRA